MDGYDPPIDDGGGCVDAWEAMTAFRADDDTPTTSDHTRRETLQKAAATLGLAFAGLTTAADDAAATSPPDETTPGTGPADNGDEDGAVQLDGREAKRYRDKALSNPEVRRIFRHFVTEEGWNPRVGDASVTETRLENGGTSHAVVIPFAAPTGEQAHIAWSTHTDWETQGVHSIHVDLDRDGENDHWRLTTYTVEASGAIRMETETVENFLGCDDVDMQCVLTIAASYAGMFAACATCSATMALPACAACIAAVLSWGAAILCDWCND